jgi:hypothetical protein
VRFGSCGRHHRRPRCRCPSPARPPLAYVVETYIGVWIDPPPVVKPRRRPGCRQSKGDVPKPHRGAFAFERVDAPLLPVATKSRLARRLLH